MRRPTLVAAGIIVVLLGLWQGGRVLGLLPSRDEKASPPPRSEHDRDRDRDDASEPAAAHGPADPVLEGARGASEATRPIVAPDDGASSMDAPEREDEAASSVIYDGTLPEGWSEAKPAQRPHAIRPPAGSRIGPRSGGVGPTGHWSRFPPPPPPRGEAGLEVHVFDTRLRPVADADVYLGPPESLHAEAVSFGDLRALGRTNARGVLLVPDLPAGAAFVAGNYHNQLNGLRGLDVRSSIPVLLVAGRAVRAHVTLPLDLDGFGTVRGRVLGEQSRPLAGATVTSGFLRTRTERDGTYVLPALPIGPQRVSAARTGYRTGTVQVEVPSRGTVPLDLSLEWKESGSLHLEGRILADEGGVVPNAILYLMQERRGTLRTTRSDADGQYRFDDLPDRLGDEALLVQAGRHTDGWPARTVSLDDGLRDAHLDITLPPRQGRLRLRLEEAGTGTPVTRCRVELERLDDPAVSVRGFTGTRLDGVFDHWYPAGRYRVEVEAPDHAARNVDVLLPGGGETVEISLELDRRHADADAVSLTLIVVLTDAVSGLPVRAGTIEVVDPATSEPVARLQGTTEDGRFSLPAPSGTYVLRAEAEGYETETLDVVLPATPPTPEIRVTLRPR